MLLHCLTVRETFLVAAKLRLPGSVSAKEKEEVVQAVVQELGLVKAAETKIGNACGYYAGSTTCRTACSTAHGAPRTAIEPVAPGLSVNGS